MGKFIFFLLTAHSLQLTAFSQYWQQQVNYTIGVSLNDKEHTLNGVEKIEYINNSPDTLTFIWFHLWPNAYKNDKTAYTDQTLENGSTKFYFSDKEQRGYINRLDFKVNSITAAVEDHPNHIDIIKLVLPSPLAPGQKISISTPFHVKLPYNFSRGGHEGQSYQATQWFPKPAVYDKNGWHPMPYLDQGEYYSEFGSFDVSITVPKNYVVAATGELQNQEEKEWLASRSAYSGQYSGQKEKNSGLNPNIASIAFPESSAETKTLRFKQNNIHDFAWFADKRFAVKHDTVKLHSGRIVDVYACYYHTNYSAWHNAVQSAKNAVNHYSGLVGEYPYNVVSVVEGPESFGGGMEYPTITVISPSANVKELDHTIAHEIGHNWFYGILASNERKYPWMDEGMNSYYDMRYRQAKDHHYADRLQQILLETFAVTKRDQPITTNSEQFTETNYGLIAYYKTSKWMELLEKELGTDVFNAAMQEYYRRWQFKHPQPEDFKKVMEEVSGKNLDSTFSLLNKTGNLPNVVKKGVAFQEPFTSLIRAAFGANANKNSVITFFPALGVNSYDKFMAGVGITNLRLPPNRLQFLLMPMYGTGSKRLSGTGFIFYSSYPDKLFRSVDIGLAASRFTVDQFTGTDNKKTFLGYHKIVPGIKLTLREKNARSSFNRYIQFKTYLFSEDGLRFYRDTVISGIDTTITDKYAKTNKNRTLNQLRIVIENNRALYPYSGELKIEQGKDFVRAGFTGNYFFNYPKEGGLNVRLFAGKFFYTSSKTIFKQFATDRYHLNMTGPNGYEDYTYSDYFIGRNKFEGLSSQQIMIRDGAFKVRTDLLADKVGKTDDWLIAANFTTTIPAAVNPLSALPVKIPLKIFLDIGTYAEAWKDKEENDRFLFAAGLQLSFLKETVNIYFPLVYSTVYRDYIQSTIAKKERFWKKISFSIDIGSFNPRKIDRNLSF